MGILQKLGIRNKYEVGANYELGNSLSSNAVSSVFGTGGSPINVLEEYNGFAWKCINVRAEMLADQELYVERRIGDKWQRDPRHEFNDVLEGSEGQNDLSELLEAHEKSMCLYGESFWYFSKGESQRKPMGVYLLDPASMQLIVRDNKVSSYIYQKDGTRIVLGLDEIDHYRVSDPRNPYRGYGPMQAAGWFVKSSRYTITYMNNFLENNAIPAGVIVASGEFDSTDWELFKEQWSNKYSGIDNAGKTGFLRGSGLDFVKTGLSLGEVDFDKIKASNRDDIMVMFGISKPMMAIFDDINRASAVTARQLFAITLTSPALSRLKRKLTKNMKVWYSDDYRINASNPVPEDEETKLSQFDKGVGRWITVNEARSAYGLEPIDGGDVIDTATKNTSTEAKSFGNKPKSIGSVRIVTKNNKAEFNYEMKESFRSQTEDIQIKYEAKFYEASNPVLKEQKERVLAQLQPKKIVDAQLDATKEADTLAVALGPIFIEMAKEQGQLAVEFVTNEQAVFELTPVMEKYINDSVAKAALGFTKDTQDKIANAVIQGLNEGESVSKISKRINELYEEVLGDQTAGWRTERLARTEIIKGSNEITEAAYKQSGIVQKKEWFANPGKCEYCASLNGSVIQLGATFVAVNERLEGVDGGTRVNSYEDVRHPPVHPACRCTLIPVIEDKQ